MRVGDRSEDLWKVAVILLGLALWNAGPGEPETAVACEAPAGHSATMLSACRRELSQVHVLVTEASDLVDLADANVELLMQRCGPILPRSPIQNAFGKM